ncbi:MAG: cobalamin-binding protein [Pirellulales bacterium]
MRIVSLLPSATEIICGLGLRENLVGVTHECDFPADVRELPHVTHSKISATATSAQIDNAVREQLRGQSSLYALDQKLLESLEPDLIVTQTLCEVCAVAESEVQRAIANLKNRPKILNLEPLTLGDLYHSIHQVAHAANCPDRGEEYVSSLRHRVNSVVARNQDLKSRPRTLILEWIDPLFCAGHWNPELVELAGGREMIGKIGERSKSISWQDLVATSPEFMMIACCGFNIERTLQDIPLLELHAEWSLLPCVRSNRVYVVDGSAYFNRPGPRADR